MEVKTSIESSIGRLYKRLRDKGAEKQKNENNKTRRNKESRPIQSFPPFLLPIISDFFFSETVFFFYFVFFFVFIYIHTQLFLKLCPAAYMGESISFLEEALRNNNSNLAGAPPLYSITDIYAATG